MTGVKVPDELRFDCGFRFVGGPVVDVIHVGQAYESHPSLCVLDDLPDEHPVDETFIASPFHAHGRNLPAGAAVLTLAPCVPENAAQPQVAELAARLLLVPLMDRAAA